MSSVDCNQAQASRGPLGVPVELDGSLSRPDHHARGLLEAYSPEVGVIKAYRSYPARGRNCTELAACLAQGASGHHFAYSRSYVRAYRGDCGAIEVVWDEWRDDRRDDGELSMFNRGLVSSNLPRLLLRFSVKKLEGKPSSFRVRVSAFYDPEFAYCIRIRMHSGGRHESIGGGVKEGATSHSLFHF
jgi:hypothetical protein